MKINNLDHPITTQSFAIIDQEIGEHNVTNAEYAIIRRVIHSTADFEFTQLIQFSPGAIAGAITSLQKGTPIITDVNMVKQGISSMVKKTFNNPILSAIDHAQKPLPGKTRTETGLLQLWEQYPQAIYAIGNAPTALITLCQQLNITSPKPALVIGAPVGFVSVLESKQALEATSVAKIMIKGRKGGSPATAAIVNALLVLAWEECSAPQDNQK